jgi:hypothetical protein
MVFWRPPINGIYFRKHCCDGCSAGTLQKWYKVVKYAKHKDVKLGFFCNGKLIKHYILGSELDPSLKVKKVNVYAVRADTQRHTNMRVALPVRLD